MTSLLQTAFAMASELSPTEEDLLASRLLEGLVEDAEFDRSPARCLRTIALVTRKN